MSSTPKIRLSPSASSASTPPRRRPLSAASASSSGLLTTRSRGAHRPDVRLADEVLLAELVGAALHADAARPRAGTRGPRASAPGGRSARRRGSCSPPRARGGSGRRAAAPSPAPAPSTARRAGSASGRDISARPIASICCSPPERLPARWRAPLLQHGEERVDALDALREVRRAPTAGTRPS